MSVLRATTSNTRRQQRGSTAMGGSSTIQQDDEFAGFWVNVGTMRPDGTFARLNRGIAVSDLQTRQIYETTDEARRDELTITNAIVRAIQGKATPKKMAEGEYVVLRNLTVVLYRKMEGTEGDSSKALDAEVENLLFGSDDEEDDILGEEEAPAPKAKPKAQAQKARRTEIEED